MGFPLTKQLNSTLTLSAWIWSQTPQLKAQSHKTTLSPHFRCQSQVEVLYIYSTRNREGNGTPLQYSRLENPTDGGAWWAAVHGVVKSRTQLSDFTFTFHFHASEKETATHSSVLAWRIPGTGEPGGLPSLWSHTVGHN